ncbi:hypothetical protein Pcinc_040252, partial [Petrolisthes cinctipes]
MGGSCHNLFVVLTIAMMATTTMTGQMMVVAQKMMSDIDVGQKMMSDIDVGQMVGQVLDQYTECHLVLLTTKPTSPVVSTIIRPVRLNPVQQGVTVSASSLSHLWKEPSTTCLTLVLHLNTNINTTILALKWKVHEQENGAFGVGTEGVFSGMMGELQREEVDIGTPPTITAGRAKIIDFARAYPSVPLVLTSLEPTLLPQHLASLDHSKVDEVWGSLLVAAVVWAVLAWVIQQVWARLTDEREFKLSTFMMYGWAALLEQSTPNPFFRNSYQ